MVYNEFTIGKAVN